MKILQVVPYFFVSWAGGREGSPLETVYGLSKALTERSHEVTVYTTDAFNKRGKAESQGKLSPTELGGVQIHEFRSIGNKLGAKYHMIISPAMIPAIARELGKFDILHLHEYRTFPNVVAHHYAQTQHIPYVLQAHGSLPRIMTKQRVKQLYDSLWGHRLLRDASRVIAVSRMEAEQYKSMGIGADKIEIVPNAIDPSQFENLSQRGEFKKKYGLSNEKIILYLGRIAQVKGIDLLMRAFVGLLPEIANIRLVIAGPDDGYLGELKNLTKELKTEPKVLFPGALYGKEKLEAYVDAEVYVLPSTYEIFGITILEACACGTPVITTDQCGLANAIRDKAGIVVPRDEDRLRDALRYLLAEDKIRREFAEQGRLLVREQFTWDRVAKKMEQIYHGILETRPAASGRTK